MAGYHKPQGSFRIAAVGASVTTTGASTHTAIPDDSSGNVARIVRVTIGAAAGYAFVMCSTGGGTVTTGHAVVCAGESLILDVRGYSHISSKEGTAAIPIVITPLE